MPRTTVITGSGSGIGASIAALLQSRGDRVIGVDLRGADVNVDLGTSQGREALPELVRELAGDHIDALYANAGVAAPEQQCLTVNYFGALASVNGLRSLLAASAAPRVVITSSTAGIGESDEELLEALRQHDEVKALDRLEALAQIEGRSPIYSTGKRAISQWIRRSAPTPEWAGAGIAVNAVAPGVVMTPLVTTLPDSERDYLMARAPMPLNGPADPVAIAHTAVFLGSAENTHVTGQIVYVDGGLDAIKRGDSVW